MAIEGAALDDDRDGITGPEGDQASDARLMRRVIEGSQDALASLYDRHGDAIFAIAQRTSRDSWVAAEVVQETFLAVWDRAEMFDPSRGTLRSWLLTIARNRAVDRRRSAARHDRAATFSSFGRDGVDDRSMAEWLTASGELIGAAGQDPAPEVALTGKETRASIDGAIASLAPAERSVIVLAYDGGLSQAEIAARLGWPLGTVKTRTRRALRLLREALERAAIEPVPGLRGEIVAAPPGRRRTWPSAAGSPRPLPCPSPCP